jgi:NaMN:DMB phosphoribosyltransferase
MNIPVTGSPAAIEGPGWCRRAAPGPDGDAAARADARQAEPTKPPGSLGRLEALAVPR